jgi:hypothetical protein
MSKLSLIAVVVSFVVMCGCESSDSGSSGAAGASSSGADAIPVGSISWLGTDYSGARITANITSASLDDRFLYTSYEPYDWPSKTVKVKVDAICCLFYERGGQVVGGKFDWWAAGGQAVKGIENLHHGYQGHSFPARGTKVYTMNVSVDGSQRTNIQEVNW